MAFGFRIRNETGIIQIDDTYNNHALKLTGTATMYESLGQPSGFITLRLADITVSGENPVIAVRATYPVGLRKVNNNGDGTWTFQLVAPASHYDGSALRYFIFDRPNPIATGFGIRVRDAAGREVFNSEHKYLRVRLFGVVPNGYPGKPGGGGGPAEDYVISGAPQGTYAVLLSRLRYAYASTLVGSVGGGPIEAPVYYCDTVRPTADGLVCRMAPFYSNAAEIATGAAWVGPEGPGYFILLDVSNFF